MLPQSMYKDRGPIESKPIFAGFFDFKAPGMAVDGLASGGSSEFGRTSLGDHDRSIT